MVSDKSATKAYGLLEAMFEMNTPFDKERLKFRALAEAALAASEGKPIDDVAKKGLTAAVEYIDLAAGALMLWDSKGVVISNTVHAAGDEERQILAETEKSLLEMLRRDFALSSAYMEMGGESARSLFSLPIEIGGRQIGALVGIKRGKARLVDYDEFLRALAAVMELAVAPATMVDELAVGISHVINNLLTPLLGNLDLLRGVSERLPEDVRKKLDVIRDSASRIGEVTARLKSASKLPRVPYVNGEWMIDLSAEDKTDEEEK